MKIKSLIFTVLALAAAATSCTKQEEEMLPQSKPFITLGDETLSIAKAGETKTVAISSNCDWAAESDQSWVKIAPAAGNQSTTALTIQVLENSGAEVRNATVTVKGSAASATLAISQTNIAKKAGDIETADEFEEFLKNASGAVETDTYTLLADIDMEGRTLAPAVSFAGIFDGKGHKVYNYKIVSQQPSSAIILSMSGNMQDVIFGSKDGKEWDGVSQVGFDKSVEATYHTGGVVANLSGNMSGVKNFATLTSPTGTSSLTGIGGLVGMTETASRIYSCENHSTISVSGITGAETYIAGIIAYVNNADALISECVNEADLNVTIHIYKASMFGGIAGRCNLGATIDKCVNNGTISYTQQDTENNGNYIMISGIAGALYTGSACTNCTNNGLVSSNNQQVSRIGGIVGTLNSGGLVMGNVNNGEVMIKQAAPNTNWQSAGGIVGFQEKGSDNIVKDNVNNGAVSVDVEINTTHANNIAAGGIIGHAVLGMNSSGNVNKAAVSCSNKGTSITQTGGIAGWLRGANCTSTEDQNLAEVSATSLEYTGSLVGRNDAAVSDGTAGGKVNGVEVTSSNIAALACGSASTGTASGLKTASGETVSELKVDKTAIDVNAEDVSATFNVTSNTSWTVSTDASWISDYTKSGSNDAVVTISFPANTSTTDARTATFTVSADKVDPVTVTLTQGKVLDSNPYNIPNAEELSLFAAASKAETPDLTRWTKDGVVALAADIDASTLSEPIALIPENVVFDGAGHKIYNITLASNGNSGLILVNKGSVKNLAAGSKDGVAYDGKSIISATGTAAHMGLVAVNEGTIDNVKNFASISYSAANSANSGIGGIAGYMDATGASIKNCVNYGAVTIADAVVVGAETYIGGIAGYLNAEEVVLNACDNRADIILGAKVNKVYMVGGILGRSNLTATIEGCTNYNAVKYVQTVAPGTWMTIGGVSGAVYTGGTMKNCVNKGEVSSDLQQVIRIGGISGVMNTQATLEKCTNYGKVSHVQKEANANWQAVGGIVGFEEKGTADKPIVVKDCTNNAEVYVKTNNSTTHANLIGAGGIFGTSCSYITISGNTNNGAVNVVNEGTKAAYAGGILGWYLKGKALSMSGNVNSGAVTLSSAVGAAGGIVGYSSIKDDACTITGDTSNASVSYSDATATGAVAGLNASKIIDCTVGGTVGGETLTEANIATLVQGSASTGTASGTKLAK